MNLSKPFPAWAFRPAGANLTGHYWCWLNNKFQMLCRRLCLNRGNDHVHEFVNIEGFL